MPRNARHSLILTVAVLSIFTNFAQSQQKVYTVAGGFVGDGRPATQAALADPQYAVFDAHGNLYISDSGNNRIRRVDSAGNITTVAGTGFCGFSGDGGPANKAELCSPSGLIFDAAGNLLFSDFNNGRVRVISPAGVINTIAGNGTFGYCGDGGPAIDACINSPEELAVAEGPPEIVYVADTFDCRIREINLKTGIINTVAGDGTCSYGGDGGPATLASLNNPYGVAFYAANHSLLISDTQNNALRRVNTQDGVIDLVYGTPGPDCDPGISPVCFPEGITFDSLGNLYVADSTDARVLKLGSTATVVVGVSNSSGFNGDGIPATSAFLNGVTSVAIDNQGHLVTVDSGNDRLRLGSGSQLIKTVAGGYIGDGGKATNALLNANLFQNNTLDAHGNLYIADAQDFRVRKVTPAGGISTFAGNGFSGYTGDGGPATQAQFQNPQGVAADKNGNIFIADTYDLAIRKVDTSGTITTFASEVFLPTGMAFDATGNLYVADFAFCTVWEFTPDGVGTIVAGEQFQCGYSGDGVPATQALLNIPLAVAVDPSTGILYIADFSNNRIRAVDSSGNISTVAGNGNCGFSGDGGPAVDAMLCLDSGVAVGANSELYIADFGNFRIRKVSGGSISTIAGNGNFGYNGNALPALQTSMEPTSVVLDRAGDILYWDLSSYRVRAVH